VRLINLGEGEQLAGLALIADTDEEEGEQTDLPQ
jgi:DNA gyrase subunit A